MRWFKFILTFAATLGLVIALDTKIGLMPPLGKFLDPFQGFWQNAETDRGGGTQTLHLPTLKAPVSILYDDRQIPHIFAKNDHDLYFTQGYVTAKDRLWQMEFQTHAAAGRLSEIVGERALEYDRFQRRIGMLSGARNALKAMEKDPVIREVVLAYTAGVNAFIETLDPKDYPVEYKILDYAPEPWTTLKCALLLKYMAWMLTGYASDLQMSNTLAKFGKEVVEDLFPYYPENMQPVIPEGTPWNFKPLPVKKPAREFVPKITSKILPYEANPATGSNNWAVSGSKTASGFPILANDPHLEMNLPSIWYEMQLTSPSVNVYGVSLPGAPNIVIGFNEKIAWGVTNGEADVMDFYEITFKDSTLTEYRHDHKWRKTRKVVEEIRVKGAGTVVDTVIYTHHGPIPYNINEKPFNRRVPVLHALRWLGHDPSNEARTFYELNYAENYGDYVDALSHYICPAQNFVFADTSGDIAIWHNGKFPAKWRGQGKFIGDGSDPLYDWQDWVPHSQNPHIKNPSRGFVSSANQNATDLTYPYYLNWYYASHYRSSRINQRLTEMKKITPDDFRKLQLDTKNLFAESVVPALLNILDESSLSPEEVRMFRKLSSWDFFNDADKIAPTIFKNWWGKLYDAIWDDEFGGEGRYFRFPSRARTVQMIVEESLAKWFDNIKTSEVETLPDLVRASFKAAHFELSASFGEMNESWQWGRYKGTDIIHLARIPGFSRLDLNVGGDLRIVNAIGKTHGPSWRMVVALGPEVKAWGIYPGGQSGNPGSPHYDDFVDDWVQGELAELLFLKSEDSEHQRIVSKLNLEAK
ncbi:penicillin acylase family protein [candidate division KSB1 bacterium]|nr:penicillin acylase family protein [candidate division KSB1 bacterium]